MRVRANSGASLTGILGRLLAAGAIVYFLLWPMVMLVRGAFAGSPFAPSPQWGLAGFRTVLSDPRLLANFRSSLALSVGVAVGSVILATYFAVLATRVKTRLARAITPMMVLIAATPSLFYAISWAMLANANAGILPRLLRTVGLDAIAQPLNAVGWPGMLTVGSLKVSGFAYLFLIGPMGAADRSQEDAAVLAGASRPQAFLGITVPLLAPAYFAVVMLLVVFGIQVYDLPAVLGMPVGIETLSLRVNDYLVGASTPDWAAANAISVLTMTFVALLILIQAAVLRGKDHVTVGGKSRATGADRPRRFGWLVDLSIAAFALIALIAPVAQFVLGSFQPFFGLYGAWTLANYNAVLSDPVGIGALGTTLATAFVGAPATVLAGFSIAYLILRRPASTLGALARIGSWVPATAPGIVLSVALLATYIATPLVRNLFGTPWLMILALGVGAIPLAVRGAEGMVAQVSRELEEAAHICGAGRTDAAIGVVARLCAPGLLGAWLLIALWMAGTLDVPLLLQSSRSQTVATYAFSLFTSGQVSQAAAVFVAYLAILAASAGIAAVLVLILRHLAAGPRREAFR